MENIDENEQWKLNGDCSKCRRGNYCSTQCTHRKRRIDASIRNAVYGTLNQITSGAMEQIIENSVYGPTKITFDGNTIKKENRF